MERRRNAGADGSNDGTKPEVAKGKERGEKQPRSLARFYASTADGDSQERCLHTYEP